ncbi:MAG: permease [Synergistaceae bacterium]|jgi:putative transport protein|nr:permease [Synergistaceae bacterium]
MQEVVSGLAMEMTVLFSILACGYLVGRFELAGLRLGSSGVLLVGLVFGHYGFTVSPLLQNLGLACFVGSVGLMAGPAFVQNLKKQAMAYIFLGGFIIVIGALTTVLAMKGFHIPKALAVGVMTGALTSTPGLAAALETTGDAMASTGYGIAYPFGVVGVVLFVQLMPRLTRSDVAAAAAALDRAAEESAKKIPENLVVVDSLGLCPFAVSIILGLLIGQARVPMPGGGAFSLGTSGGPLLSGLLVGAWGRVWRFSCRVPGTTLNVLREVGLILFLAAAGTSAGRGFLEVAAQYGWSLFFTGALITLLPMLLAYFIARCFLGFSELDALSSICGGMTSTPGLGALIGVAKSTGVATAYAATYPSALLLIVFAAQLLAAL